MFSHLLISYNCSCFNSGSTNMTKVTKYFNCNILKNGKILKQDLWVEDGQIVDPEIIFYDKKKMPDFEIDCLGSLISPGFIDLQING